MSDWQVGDLALCVRGGKVFDRYDVRAGQIFTVHGVTVGSGRTGLLLVERPVKNPFGFLASAFRKVTPPEADAFDLSVIEQMTGAPVEVVG